MRRSAFTILAIIAACVLGQQSEAGSSGNYWVQGIVGSDDRQLLKSTGPPWDAIGRVQFAGYNDTEKCTGTLIAPDLVITAAHCLFHRLSHKPLAPERLHFVAGLKVDKWVGHSTVACFKSLAPLTFTERPTAESEQDDAVMLVLKNKLKIAPVALAEDQSLPVGAAIDHVGYSYDRPDWPVLDSDCHVTSRPGDLVGTDCDATYGNSGGPVFVKDNGTRKIAAIMVFMSSNHGNLAVPVSRWRKLVSDTSCDVKSTAKP